jgi:tRNA(Arg) A34 adenosine deaminase TadA
LGQTELVRMGQTPFGAVVLGREGSLVGEGPNRVRADLDPPAHGEIVAGHEAAGLMDPDWFYPSLAQP